MIDHRWPVIGDRWFDDHVRKARTRPNRSIFKRNEYIGIIIFDNGTGFKNKKKEELIKPYFTTKKNGSGRGLSIVNKIITDHNGEIKFSNYNDGAKIQINFN